jgi:hypothetical protein
LLVYPKHGRIPAREGRDEWHPFWFPFPLAGCRKGPVPYLAGIGGAVVRIYTPTFLLPCPRKRDLRQGGGELGMPRAVCGEHHYNLKIIILISETHSMAVKEIRIRFNLEVEAERKVYDGIKNLPEFYKEPDVSKALIKFIYSLVNSVGELEEKAEMYESVLTRILEKKVHGKVTRH